MTRRDWRIGRLHVIKRSYRDPQYGLALWGVPCTLDVWIRRTLWTFRMNRP